jgi:hypothetical protein
MELLLCTIYISSIFVLGWEEEEEEEEEEEGKKSKKAQYNYIVYMSFRTWALDFYI